MKSKVFLYLVLLFLFFEANSQSDTIFVKKAPVIIEKKVFYTSLNDADGNKNAIRFFINSFAPENHIISDQTFNQIKTSTSKFTQQQVNLSWSRKIARIDLGLGLGIFSFKDNILQESYTLTSKDSTLTWQKDTLDEYFVNGKPHYIIDSSQYWKFNEKENSYKTNNFLSSTYLCLPIQINKNFYKGKFTFSIGALVSNYLRIHQKGKVLVADENGKVKEITKNFHSTIFTTLAPEIAISYRFYKELNLQLNYQYILGMNKVHGLKDNTTKAKSAFGLGLMYKF